MSRIVIFGGTTEGRRLSEYLSGQRMRHSICVATSYGEQILDEDDDIGAYADVFCGRMDGEEMINFLQNESAEVAVDATHPYAAEATKNIKLAAEFLKIQYIRLDRDGGGSLNKNELKHAKNGLECEKYYFADSSSCADALKNTDGNILLTTGSKELSEFASHEEIRSRIFARVIPGVESISECKRLGLSGRQIIAMQGPFSTDLNSALIREYDIKILVTKDGGAAGGFKEKAEAAGAAGAALYIIKRPESISGGMSFEEVCRELLKYSEDDVLRVSLIGCGMGSPDGLTTQAKREIDKADVVFGSKRLLESLNITTEHYPYYLARDIIPELRDRTGNAVVLFSGDVGFYSGAAKLGATLKNEVAAGNLNAEIKVYPGISSVSAAAAAFGITWEDARIISTHGAGDAENWGAALLHSVRYNKKTFVLLSGLEDLKQLCKLLGKNGLGACRLLVAYNISYPSQELFEAKADAWRDYFVGARFIEPENLKSPEVHRRNKNTGAINCAPTNADVFMKEGLYSAFIINDSPDKHNLTPGLTDFEFIRGSVPMTKEEVREVCISKMRLYPGAVVYDIGSGTGSIAIEISRLSPDISVYAIERKDEALELIEKNKKKFGLMNLHVVRGEAPETLSNLPAPTHAFVGGSGGRLYEIIDTLLEANPKTHIVANAVSLKTLSEFAGIEEKYAPCDFELIQIQTTRTHRVGGYRMQKAENPVWICSFKKTGQKQPF